jgi:hypothetical protein
MSNKDDIFDDDKSDKGNKTIKADGQEFCESIGVDIGTSSIVSSRKKKNGEFVNKFHRNMLFPIDVSDEASDLLEKSSYNYVKVDKKYFIFGDDSISICNAMGEKNDLILRPMSSGIINPNLKESSDLLLHIIKSVVGEPLVKGEKLRVSIPGQAINQDIDNTFHKMVLLGLFRDMGYDPKPVNEAMAIAYSENPTSKDGEEIVPLSGVSISCGAGQTNLALLFKGMELGSFSITKSGDYIDEQVAKATGVPKSKIIKRKEKDFSLINVDHKDKVLSALSIYYTEYIDRICHLMAKEFTKRGSEISGALEIVVGGGGSIVPGFIPMLENSIKEQDFPFKILKIRHAKNPFFAVSNGCLLRALSDTQKQERQK